MSDSNDKYDSLKKKIDDIVQKYISATGNIGLAIGVIDGDHENAMFYGSIDRDSETPPDENIIFEIGSIGKVFPVLQLAKMAGKGEVHLDDPIEKHLPAEVTLPRFRGKSITLQHLATHTSGLPRLPGNLGKTVTDPENPYANYTVEHLYEYLSTCRLWRQPCKKAVYSNLGMGLLGDILGLVRGKSYEATVIERICQPLGMTNTTITLSDDQTTRLAQGHSSSGKPVPLWDWQCLHGAGAHRSSLKDMLKFASANQGDSGPLGHVLESCQEPRPTTATLPSWWRRYGAAIVLAAVGVAVQKLLDIRPGRFLFMLPTMTPVLGSAFFCGTGAGLLTAALVVAGSYALCGKGLAWDWALVISASLAWWASTRFRNRTRVGLGWHILPLYWGGPDVIWHNRGTGGFASFLGLVKESNVAVVVLSNSQNSVDAIAHKLLRFVHQQSAAIAK